MILIHVVRSYLLRINIYSYSNRNDVSYVVCVGAHTIGLVV